MNYPPGTFGYERLLIECEADAHMKVVADAMEKLTRISRGDASVNEVRSESGLPPLDNPLANLKIPWRLIP